MGTVVLSADAELGWGFHDLAEPPGDRLENARWGWQQLLTLCDRYEVPATWAVVGHLLLRDCDGWHEDHPAPPRWFARERGHDRLPRKLRFGDGLVTAIQDASVDHDIGSHTFSHVVFGDPGTTRQLAHAEIERSVEVAAERGLDVDSFVFPRNRVGYRDALPAHGIRCYRGPRPAVEGIASGTGVVGKLARVTVSDAGPPLVEPTVDAYGLVDIPASLFLFGFEGPARRIAEPIVGDPIVTQARRGIEKAAREDGIFHMWLHPNDLTGPDDVRRMEQVFTLLAEARRRSAVEIRTMAEVATDVAPSTGADSGADRDPSRRPVR